MSNVLFEHLDQSQRKMIADAIFVTISKPVVTDKILKLRYPFLADQTINELLTAMVQLSIISKLPNGTYQVNPRKITDILPPVLWLLMTEGRYKKEEIEEVLSKLPPLDKKRISAILSNEKSGFKWIDIHETPAPEDTPIAIRFTDLSKSYGETIDTIYEAEDMKIAILSHGDWTIIPPYPLFDYSPLSNKESINNGAIVTHWAEVSDEDMEGWKSRFDPLGTYKYLDIKTDDEHKEIVYKSLLRAATFIRQTMEANNNNPEIVNELMEYYKVLADLQYCMDSGRPLQNQEENKS